MSLPAARRGRNAGEWNGEPDVRQLEPDDRLAGSIEEPAASRVEPARVRLNRAAIRRHSRPPQLPAIRTMRPPANIRPITGIARPTAFKPGQSGNPAGRRPGTRWRVTIEAQLAATQPVG